MKAFWTYNGLRLLVWAGCFVIIAGVWLLIADSLNWPLALIVSLLVSGVVSYPLLNRQRAAFAVNVQTRAAKAKAAYEARAGREDDEEDA